MKSTSRTLTIAVTAALGTAALGLAGRACRRAGAGRRRTGRRQTPEQRSRGNHRHGHQARARAAGRADRDLRGQRAAAQRIALNDVRALGQIAPGLVLSNPAGFNATGGGMRGTGHEHHPRHAGCARQLPRRRVRALARDVAVPDAVRHAADRGLPRTAGHAVRQEHDRRRDLDHDEASQLNEYTAEIEAGYGQYDSGAGLSRRQGRAQPPAG